MISNSVRQRLSRRSAFVSFLDRHPERGVDLLSRVFLHARKDVAVGIECNPNLGVPEALTHYLGVDALPKKLCRVRVSKIVEPNVRQP